MRYYSEVMSNISIVLHSAYFAPSPPLSIHWLWTIICTFSRNILFSELASVGLILSVLLSVQSQSIKIMLKQSSSLSYQQIKLRKNIITFFIPFIDTNIHTSILLDWLSSTWNVRHCVVFQYFFNRCIWWKAVDKFVRLVVDTAVFQKVNDPTKNV